MVENQTTPQDAPKKESILDKAEEMAGIISDKAGKAWDKMETEAEQAWVKAKNSEYADIAKKKFDSLKKEANELMEKAKSGELTDKAKEKFEALKTEAKILIEKANNGELAGIAKEKFGVFKDEAKELWNKVVHKFEGEENKKQPPQEGSK